MNKDDPWFFEYRADLYAKLVLTRQHDVRFSSGSDAGVDLLVEIRTKNPLRPRIFGVMLVPFMDMPDLNAADEEARSQCRRAAKAIFPVCAFVISMRETQGIYRWAVEPVVVDGEAVLRRDAPGDWHPLDQPDVDALMAQVNAWYDALNGALPAKPKPRGRRSKSEA